MGDIRILIVDDHRVVRQGFCSLLELEAGFNVVGEAGTGAEALKLIHDRHPDIVLLDLKLPDMNGAEVCRRATATYPDVAILMLTAISSGPEVLKCIDAGAQGYILKDVDISELTRTIRALHQGDSVLDSHVTSAVLERARRQARGPVPGGTLTEREQEIVRLIARGLTNKEIGQTLFMSPSTVKFHISEIMQKLEVKSRTQVAFKAGGDHLI
jgi:DNA-binding NarL/FixJ family response regulator